MSTTPDLESFKKISAQHPGKLIPVSRTFLADTLTPVAAFRRLADSAHGFLLESVERGERVGRYSFVGAAPEIVFYGEVLPEPTFRIVHADGRVEEGRGDPLAKLESYIAAHPALAPDAALGVPPFAGGAVGYLGYDIVRLFEPRLLNKPPKRHAIAGVPDVLVPVYRTIVAFDHVKNAVFAVHHADPRVGGAQAAYAQAEAALAVVAAKLAAPMPDPLSEMVPSATAHEENLVSNMTPEQYIAAVLQAKEFIAAGDIIQVVLSQRMTKTIAAPPFEVYRSLRAINPSPYMFYLKNPTVHIVGSSPEIMVRLEDGLLTVRPIAGTRPRGRTPAEDAALAKDLLADQKEIAEHVMLLDLGRNDVGRVSRYGSVQVTERLTIEQYSHVMHIVSNVTGILDGQRSAFDVLRACHPAGTVSGAPKIRAMEIIDQLEPDSRGPYAGAVGVIDLRGNLNTAIALRTFFIVPKGTLWEAHIQAGAGIVADSVPRAEYEETRNKARALLRSLDAAEARRA